MDVQETDAGTGLAGVVGLTGREAEARRRRGEGNVAVSASSRSYARILRTNVFSFFNVILFVIGAALLALGRYNDAFTSVGLGLVNAGISAVQEIRAKRKLDRLQLLSRSPVTVLRDGRETSVPQEDVVRGDVLCVRRLAAEARQESTDTTPLQRRIQFVVRLVMVLVALMSAAILLQAALEGFSLVRVVQTTAVLSGLVPYGLFFLVAVAYTVGAAKSSGRGALVQQVNAVESVSNVDVVCTDKTGTLTTGRLSLAELRPVGPLGAAAVEHLVGSLARSTTAANLTSSALAAALPGAPWEVREEVPFSSSLRWSALRTDDGVVVLGAPDALAPALSGAPLTDTVAAPSRVSDWIWSSPSAPLTASSIGLVTCSSMISGLAPGRTTPMNAPGNSSEEQGAFSSTGIMIGARNSRFTGLLLRMMVPPRTASRSPGRPMTRLI